MTNGTNVTNPFRVLFELFDPFVISVIPKLPRMLFNKNGGKANLPPEFRRGLLGNAIAFHTFEQLREIPDLLIGGGDASGQIGGLILQI